jgi:hypothetical protein
VASPTSQRPKQEVAFVAAVSAVHAVVEAREAAVHALTALADSLAAPGVAGEHATFDEVLALPLERTLGWYHPQTFALWGEVGSTRSYLADDGAGSSFEFDALLTVELADVATAFRQWLVVEEARPSNVDDLLLAFDKAAYRRAHGEDAADIAADLAVSLRSELDALEHPALAVVGGEGDAR